MATPKRVRTYRPKHSDTSLSRKWRINMANKKNIYPCDSFSLPTSALKHLNALLRARLTTVLEISKSLIAI